MAKLSELAKKTIAVSRLSYILIVDIYYFKTKKSYNM